MLKLLIFVALSTTCLCYPVDDTNIQNPVEQQQQQVQPTPQQTDKQTKNSALPRDILQPDGNLSKRELVGKPDNGDLKTEPSEWDGFGRDFDHGHDHGHGHDHHDHDHGHHHHDHGHGHHHHDHGHYHGHGHGYGHGNGFEFGFGYPNYHRPYYNTYYPSYGPSIYPQYYPQNNYVGGGSIFW